MTWLHLLNDCAEINKMLNVPPAGRSKNYPGKLIHYPLSRAPAPTTESDHSKVKQGCFRQVVNSPSNPFSFNLLNQFCVIRTQVLFQISGGFRDQASAL